MTNPIFQPTKQTVIDYGYDIIRESFDFNFIYLGHQSDPDDEPLTKLTVQDFKSLPPVFRNNPDVVLYDFNQPQDCQRYINLHFSEIEQDLINNFTQYQNDIDDNRVHDQIELPGGRLA